MTCPGNALVQKIIIVMAISLFVFISFTIPAMALPPAIEVDKLMLSAAAKIDNGNYTAAGQDLKKITSLNVKLPVNYYYLYGRYLAATRQAVAAKKNLEIFLDKDKKKGQFYMDALRVYSMVEANEKRWAKEIEAEKAAKKAEKAAKKRLALFYQNNNDGTVTDTQTGLMWASKDNGEPINWKDARAYCQNYNGGDHTDWRLPTPDELATLCQVKYLSKCIITPLIKIKPSETYIWSSKVRGSEEAAYFDFGSCDWHWSYWYYDVVYRALPVRSGK